GVLGEEGRHGRVLCPEDPGQGEVPGPEDREQGAQRTVYPEDHCASVRRGAPLRFPSHRLLGARDGILPQRQPAWGDCPARESRLAAAAGGAARGRGAAGAGAPARAEGHVPRPEARERGDALFHAKLTDFGLAKKMHNATEANTVCGSHGYVAPEILLPSKGYTLAVDVYSFGVVMYMLCSGGEQSQRRPGVRTPPMRHASLGRRLREAAGASPAPRWALREEGALELVRALTGGQDPQARPSATAAKDLRFFVRHLGGGARGGVDALLSEAAACCAPPEETSQRALQTQGSRAAGVTLPTRAATLDKNAGRACSLLRLPIPASSFSSILSHLSPSLPPTPPPPRRLASLARVRLFPVAW
ncbi:unnamed protein product, partial [Prorocentrum cordatum]